MGGIAVTIGARVAALAGPSEVFISQTVGALVAGSGFAFADAGLHELKGVRDRWHLYRAASATWTTSADRRTPGKSQGPPRRVRNLARSLEFSIRRLLPDHAS